MWGKKTSKRPPRRGVTFRVLPCWFRRRSRGWARNGRAVKALRYGAAGETKKSKFAKRTWNVAWNQQIDFFGAVHRPGRRGSHTSQKARCMECQDKPG